MELDSSDPSHKARRASFLSFSVAPFTHFGPSSFEKGGQLGWWSNNYRLTVQCSWVDGWNIGVNGDKLNGMTVEMSAWTVTSLMGWRFGKTEVVRYTKFWRVAQKHLWRMTHVIFGWFLSGIEASLRLPCTFPIKTTPFPSHFSTFRRKHIVRASPSSLLETCPFNSCIIRSHPFTLFLGK